MPDPNRRAALLLVLAVTFWAGNFLVGRAVRGDVPPVTLAFGRWVGASLLLAPFALRGAWRARAALWEGRGVVLALSALGVAAFNTWLYVGLQTTTALNAFLLQAGIPVLIVVLGAVAFREALPATRVAGLALSLAGAAWVVLEGDPARLATLQVARGDLWVLAAVASYAGYSVLLRRRPDVPGVPFAFTTFVVGALLLLPFWVVEARAEPFAVGAEALAAWAYVTVFPSILSYLAFNRGVAILGSARAGPYLHLLPVLGSVGAVALLGERFAAHHAVGVTLVALGIALATRRAGGSGDAEEA